MGVNGFDSVRTLCGVEKWGCSDRMEGGGEMGYDDTGMGMFKTHIKDLSTYEPRCLSPALKERKKNI